MKPTNVTDIKANVADMKGGVVWDVQIDTRGYFFVIAKEGRFYTVRIRNP